ncbi:Uncharacterised protein [Klebsiella pneumoniae]|uniref:hypothetical protein n=4 Tax=Klebsiella pneumoniae TaxID=573 RepID=UPI0007CA29B3|nr:hypothetical protein [Klebsiella pneumoniae]EMC4137153.1 hypothetical protein [Cronobacter sakazakii]HBR1419720.1 hypothetical protein [Klebsiella quasipneumoniae subsp. similipneumoniae]MBY8405866.1 hypothetical protein [Klebsiella pneumoniae]MDW1425347.1 hypothetical protein [Klebsiella pneumoniae]SAS67692.1 Uncharacterised protein [Klebsiella pneumoniae]
MSRKYSKRLISQKPFQIKTSGDFIEIVNPFKGLSEEKIKDITGAMSLDAKEKVPLLKNEIIELIKDVNPMSLLSSFVTSSLTVVDEEKGVSIKDSKIEIPQYYIEYIQAIFLTLPPEQFNYKSKTKNEVYEKIKYNLDCIFSVNMLTRFDGGLRSKSDEEKSTFLMRILMQGQTTAVRNWGYYTQVKKITLELYGHFNDELRENFGFSVENVVKYFDYLIGSIETRINERMSKLRLYYDFDIDCLRNNILSEIDANEFMDITGSDIHDANKETLIHSLLIKYMNYDDLLFVFNGLQVSADTNIAISEINCIQNYFSLERGQLAGVNREYLTLDNPVWYKPLIKKNQDEYYCFIPQVFFSFIIPIFDDLISSFAEGALSDRKGTYLEEKINEIIKSKFNEAVIYNGLKWTLDGQQYETDVLTLIDSFAIIFEAKSGKISKPALRGAPERLKKHINELIVSPCIQSQRLRDRLFYLNENLDVEDDLTKKLGEGLRKIKKVVRVSISLETFGAMQSNMQNIKDSGWFAEDLESCPSMCLADFETIIDVLDKPSFVLHYLSSRQRVESEYNYFGDELDLLGTYLETLFCLEKSDGKTNLILTTMSQKIDDYYISLESGVRIDKPKPKVRKIFMDIIEQLEIRKTYRWLELSLLLNNIHPNEQAVISGMINEMKRNVRKKWRVSGHVNSVIYASNVFDHYGFCYFAYCNKNQKDATSFSEACAHESIDIQGRKLCLVVGKNLDDHNVAYNKLALYGDSSLVF